MPLCEPPAPWQSWQPTELRLWTDALYAATIGTPVSASSVVLWQVIQAASLTVGIVPESPSLFPPDPPQPLISSNDKHNTTIEAKLRYLFLFMADFSSP
jgi:hypothetical protein